jgi:hypothetical protein
MNYFCVFAVKYFREIDTDIHIGPAASLNAAKASTAILITWVLYNVSRVFMFQAGFYYGKSLCFSFFNILGRRSASIHTYTVTRRTTE